MADTTTRQCKECGQDFDSIYQHDKGICDDCNEKRKKLKELEDNLRRVILPVEVPKDEYKKVIDYLITIGFFKNYI